MTTTAFATAGVNTPTMTMVISQEHLPLYLSPFQFLHQARVRSKGLLP